MQSRMFGALASCLLCLLITAHAGSDPRLSKEVTPQIYHLTFEPSFNTYTFAGSERIKITVHSETQTITLNAVDLVIDKAVIKSNSTSSQPARVVYQAKTQRVVFHFKTPIKPGEYSLECTFKGTLNNQLRGFYRTSYGNDKKHWIAATQMEPTDARRMFPCFDEPDFKAIYQITAIIDPRFVAISNSQVLKETISHGKKKVVFEATPLMSTYLVALIVGELARTGTKIDANGVPISVWTTPGKQRFGVVALDMACEILPMQAKYFGIPYPGKKLDIIALPDFNAGAMENMGAITFKEALLLVDEKTGTTKLKQTIASIEAHEIAHQWFGNLVTMTWWDDLWLNEAFATWMSTKTIEALHPEWRFLAKSINDYNDAKKVDQLKATRPIYAPVLSPAQAIEMFDTITYEKGAALLRMLECFVGEKIFQQAIHAYLTKYSFGNATTHDLWKEISLAASDKIPINAMMNSWVYQAGFPLVVALQQDDKAMHLEQTRFFGAADAKTTDQIWQIPIVFDRLEMPERTRTGIHRVVPAQAGIHSYTGIRSGSGMVSRLRGNDRRPSKLLFTQKDTAIFQMPKDLVFANKNGVGFFRVQYTNHDFNLIAKRFTHLSPEEKLVFLSDSMALAIAGKMSVENALNLMLKIKDETDPLVQLALVKAFMLPLPSMNGSSKASYEQLLQTNLRPLKIQLGWWAKKGEPVLNNDVRDAVIVMLGTYGQDRQTIDEAFKLFHQYLQNKHSVYPDSVSAMLRIIAFNGNEKEYRSVMGLWRTAQNPEDEQRFLATLTMFNSPALIDHTLDLSLSDEVRAQDRALMLSRMLQRIESQDQTWHFIKAHWINILQRFPETELSQIPLSCGVFYTTAAEKDLTEFFSSHNVPYAKSAVARALEEVHTNVIFQQNNAATIRAWCARKP